MAESDLILKNTEEALHAFGRYVVQQSRSRLSKSGTKKGKLYNSIDYKIEVNLDNLIIKFPFMKKFDYAKFIDQGVKGKDPSKVSPNAKIKGQQAPQSQYKFGSRKYKGTFDKFTENMTSFAKNRNIRFRDSGGKFDKGSYKSMGYVIAKNIYYRGIKPKYFFSKSFDMAFDSFPNDLLDAFALDVKQKLKNLSKK